MKIKVITAPQDEPVSLPEVKLQLRIDDSDNSYDEILEPLITAAREWCEGYQNRAYVSQTLELALDTWCDPIKLPRPPLRSVTSITYTDSAKSTVTWDPANYIVDDYSQPAEIVRAANIRFPEVSLAPTNGVKIRYIAGYENRDLVPTRVKQAILLLVSHWFDNGVTDPPDGVLSLLNLDRLVPI